MGLKILHSADWHLDSPFASFSEEERDYLKSELRRVPERIARVCREEGCDLVLLAGDIFDGDYSRETARLLKEALASCGVPVFIAPGNHDYVGPGSPWTEERWPSNVFVFRGGMTFVDLPELNCRVYGAGYETMDCPPLLEGFAASGNMRYRVAVLHGDPTKANSPYNPITAAQVGASGLDYLALGHIHKAGGFQAGDTVCAWPGCPMGRGWDETEEKGICIVTLEDEPRLDMRELNTPRFFERTAEIGSDAGLVLEDLLPPGECFDFYRVTLTGTGNVDLDALQQRWVNLPHLTLRDRTEAPVDIWAEAGADSLRGVFFKMLRDAVEEADEADAARILRAAEISYRILEGKGGELL